MLILVLGASGFLGGHIARAAFEKGWRVRGLRRNPMASGNIGDLPIDWIQGDLGDLNLLVSAMEGVDAVFHAAGYYPRASQNLSLKPHLARAQKEIHNVLQACQQAAIRRLIYTSSLSTIGQPPEGADRLADERDVYIPGSLPNNPYYEVKITMENAVVARGTDLDAVVVNPTVVLGPGDVHSSSTRFIRSFLQGKLPVYIPAMINLIDVRDMAAAQLVAAEKGRSGERYILGGHNLTMDHALIQVAQDAGVPPPKFKVPLGLLVPIVRIADKLPGIQISSHVKAVRTWQGYNTAKAERELDLSPRPVTATLQDTIAWLKAEI